MFSGVADLKKVFEEARFERLSGHRTLLFVDEIHRFNRAQQDGFLPVMEDGTITLVGATTENPSFELNAALLSRAQVLRLNPFSAEELELMAQRAEAAMGQQLPLDDDARTALYELSDGDGRAMLGLVEEVFAAVKPGEILDKAALLQVVQRRAPIYDKKQDGPLQSDFGAAQDGARLGPRRGAVLPGADAGGGRGIRCFWRDG